MSEPEIDITLSHPRPHRIVCKIRTIEARAWAIAAACALMGAAGITGALASGDQRPSWAYAAGIDAVIASAVLVIGALGLHQTGCLVKLGAGNRQHVDERMDAFEARLEDLTTLSKRTLDEIGGIVSAVREASQDELQERRDGRL